MDNEVIILYNYLYALYAYIYMYATRLWQIICMQQGYGKMDKYR
jgi:hypothetical protein